jgi:branched-chain amino acid transport system substrate-binding protein
MSACRFRRLTFAAVGAALCLTSSCQLFVDTTVEQCKVDTDCKTPLSRCTEEMLCTTRCELHSQCQRFGTAFACISDECVDVESQECSRVVPEGALSDDRTLLFGFITSKDDYGQPLAEGAELALREINANGQTLPAAKDGEETRKLALVMCAHDPADSQEALTAARHLADVVKVPAILGSSYSGVTKSVGEVVVPKGVLVVSPSATSPGLSGARGSQDSGIKLGLMVRRTAPSDTLQGELIKWLVADVVNALITGELITSVDAARVAAVVKDDLAGQGLFDAVTTTDETRGDAAAAPIRNLKYETYGEKTSDWQAIADAVVETKPHIVLGLGTGEFVDNLLPLIEASADPKPWYVLPEGNRLDGLLELAQKNPDWGLTSRVIGTAPGARTSSRYNNFASRFDNAFSKPPGNLAEFAYDTVYWVAYGLMMAGEHYPSGERLANAMQRVTCKDEDRLTNPEKPTEFYGFAGSLRTNSCFDFEGVSGPLDFDPVTGDAESDIAVWCLRATSDALSYEPNLNDFYSVEANAVVRCENPPLDFSAPNWCPSVTSTARLESCP